MQSTISTSKKNILKYNKMIKYIIKTQTLIFLKKAFKLLIKKNNYHNLAQKMQTEKRKGYML